MLEAENAPAFDLKGSHSPQFGSFIGNVLLPRQGIQNLKTYIVPGCCIFMADVSQANDHKLFHSFLFV